MTLHADRDLGPLREMQDQRSKDSFPLHRVRVLPSQGMTLLLELRRYLCRKLTILAEPNLQCKLTAQEQLICVDTGTYNSSMAYRL